MNSKKILTTGFTIALLCIVMLAGFANANPTTVTAATPFTINGGTYAGTAMWVSVQDDFGPWFMNEAGEGSGMILTMSASVDAYSYISIHAIQLSGFSDSPLTVWTAPTANGPWTQAGATQEVDSYSWTWYNFISGAEGQYISFTCYDATENSGIRVDYVCTM